ncbi:MAG: hypothetical protein ABL962_08225, partial [Fimbriimonadaceae bacterium]
MGKKGDRNWKLQFGASPLHNQSMPLLLVVSALATSNWLCDIAPNVHLKTGSVIAHDRLGYVHVKTRQPALLKRELRSLGSKIFLPESSQRLNRSNLASLRAYREMLRNAPVAGGKREFPGEHLGAQEYFVE